MLADLNIRQLDIRRFDVDTPCGTVHLAAFPKGTAVKGEVPPHRLVIASILSQVCGREVSVDSLVHGKALLDSDSAVPSRPTFPGLDFDVNWTHSGETCILAYGDGGSLSAGKGLHIGVDMEVHSPRHLRVAKRFYSPEENLHLESLDESRRLLEFFRLWCRKEALFKCVGDSFFESALGRNVLETPLPLAIFGQVPRSLPLDVNCSSSPEGLPSGSLQVHFVDVPWDGPASLCIAVALN